MSTVPVGAGVKGKSARQFPPVQSSAKVLDLSEYRSRLAADPLSGVRRRLRRKMTSKGVSVESLAAMSGVHPVTVGMFFRGLPASPREITRIASALGMSWSLLSGRA